MTDDRPVSSEEMIRRAREEMSKPPPPPTHGADLTAAAEELAEDVEAAPDPATVRFTPSRERRRRSPLPADPFAVKSRSAAGRPNPARALVAGIVTILLLGIGLAVLFASVSTAP